MNYWVSEEKDIMVWFIGILSENLNRVISYENIWPLKISSKCLKKSYSSPWSLNRKHVFSHVK